MRENLQYQKNNEPVQGNCILPFPKEDEITNRLARRFAQAFFHALKKKQYVVLCNVSARLSQAITLGAWIAGHPVAYINPAFTKIQLSDVLTQLGASLNIGNPDCLSSLENKNDWLSPDPDGTGESNLFDRLQPAANEDSLVPHEWRDDECAAVIFTSGSTGRPKGVCHSVGNLTRSAELFIRQYAIKPDDRLLNLAPLHAASGVRSYIFVPLLSGCQLIEIPNEPSLEDVLNTLHSEKPTVFISGPLVFRQLAMLADKLNDELSSIRLLFSTGAKLDKNSRVRLWEKKRLPVLNWYGSTEAPFVIGEQADRYQPELDIIGQPFPDVRVEFVEVEGFSYSESSSGQIRVHSPNLFLGYLGEALVRKRYFDTGDLGMRDEAGNISLKGRLDDRVKTSNTLWLFPQALEQLLVNRSDVVDVHVCSKYDKYDRGFLFAKVVPCNSKIGSDDWLANLGQDVEDQLGPDYKAIDIEIVSAIHRTALGKIIKSTD